MFKILLALGVFLGFFGFNGLKLRIEAAQAGQDQIKSDGKSGSGGSFVGG